MDQPSSSKEADEIVLDSDSELDEDEVIEISDDSSSSDEESSKRDEAKSEGAETAKEPQDGKESDEEEDEEEEAEGGSASESLESEEEAAGDESTSEEDEEESEEESDGEDSVWDSFDEENVIAPSQEAHEASIMRDFHAGLDDMLAGNGQKAQKAFEKVLKHPIVGSFYQENINWERDLDENLSKMARVFVGCHKNLATLDETHKMDHLLQVLSVCPKNNSQMWMDLGFCSLEKGDPTLAKYAFKKANCADGQDALISVVYLTGEYHACLEYIKLDMDNGNVNKKFIYLKERIRAINDHFRQFHDELFQEDRLFSERPTISLTEADEKELKERVERAREKYSNIKIEDKPEVCEPLTVEIDFESDLKTVCTLFCDLFDRIESYSSLARQKIHFKRWDNHQIYLDATELVERMLTVVESAEDLVKQVDEVITEEEEARSEATSSGEAGSQQNVRKSMRMLERGRCSPDTIATVSLPGSVEQAQTALPPTELSSHFKLECPYIIPLMNVTTRPSRTPTPNGAPEFFSEGFLLTLIRAELMDSSRTIREVFETALICLSDVCPEIGSMPKHLYEVMMQLYRRFNRTCSNLEEEKYLKLHVLMDDIGDDHGRDYTTRWHYSDQEWPDRNLALRYAWNCARYFTRETTKLEYLDVITRGFDEDEVLMTGVGTLCLYDIRRFTERVAKVERIRSIKLYGETNMHEEVVKIMSTDIQYSSLEPSEVPAMLNYWFNSLFSMDRMDDLVDLLCRVICHFLNEPEFDEMLPMVMEWYDRLDLERVSIIGLSALGFVVCHVVERKKRTWSCWKKLYEIIRQIEGPISTAYLSTLTVSSHDDALPLLSLELLMKAHEALSVGGHCCKDNQGEFIAFTIHELAKVYDHPEMVEMLLKQENVWILSNLDEEIDQLLHCGFGKYSKRRRQMSDHHSKPAIIAANLSELAIPALTLAVPRPLPLFEDKERLGHDAPELIASKFPEVIEFDQEREDVVVEFTNWLKGTKKEITSWPCASQPDTELQAAVWYVMALSSYRQNSNSEETKKYCELFLTSGRATYSNPVTTSAWGMLAHTVIGDLFKLEVEQMFRQWEWRTMPYRVGIHVDKSIGILHFQLGNALYQLATVFKRYVYELPYDHYLYKQRSLVGKLRQEAQEAFEACVQIPPPDNKIEEYQWLSFFFLAKLHAKKEPKNVVKVVDNFFEAACCSELGDLFWYPQKINIKKQVNLEPVELHYQLFNAIWKYLKNTPQPSEQTLLTLLSYARAFKHHKVVKSANSLFQAKREIDEMLLGMCSRVEKEHQKDEDDIVASLNMTIDIVDLVDELWKECYKAFELVYERFPHPKAAFRLAEMEIERKKYSKAHDYIVKGIFRRRKKEDGFFDNLIEINSPDISRSTSYEYHVERSTDLLIIVLVREKDVSNMLQLLLTLITAIGEKDEAHVRAPHRRRIFKIIFTFLQQLYSEANSPKVPNSELVRVWQKMNKYENVSPLLKDAFKRIVQPKVGDLDRLVEQQTIRDEMARKPGRKRKGVGAELGAEQQAKRSFAAEEAPRLQPILPRPTVPVETAMQLLVQSVLQPRSLEFL